MNPILPQHRTEEAFEAADAETDYDPALRVVAQRAGIIAAAHPTRFTDGSLPVFALGELVVKLYPPCCQDEYDNERAALEGVEGALPIPTPAVQSGGALDGWHYLVMTRLRGRPMRVCFNELASADRLRLSAQLGEAVARLHALETTGVASEDWPIWLASQKSGCVERHRKAGLDPVWLARIEPFLDEVVPTLPTDTPHSLLHTEIMREHVFVDRVAGRFELSGLLDFEPARVGPWEYELSSAGLFFSEGDAAMWGGFLDGLGVSQDGRTELARRCMAWGLLHRYANLRGWLQRLPPRSARASFDDLAKEWFGTSQA